VFHSDAGTGGRWSELFTGNNLIVMAWASGRVSMARMLRNWVIVYLGNLVGALGLVVLVVLSRHLEMNNGRLAQAVIDTASAKIRPDFVTLFFKGILCNVLVSWGLACLCGRSSPISCRSGSANLGLCGGRLRALHRQLVLSAAGLADHPHRYTVSKPRRVSILIAGIVHNLVR
jgi:glycerol uptake facilitator-like aquaporin